MGLLGVLTSIPSSRWLRDVVSSAIAKPLKTPIASFFVSVLLSLFNRGQIDQAIAQSEQLFAAFMDNLPGFVWMKDLDGRYVYVNQRLKRLAPYQNGCLSKTDAEIWPREIAATFRENDLRVSASRETLETVEPYQLGGQDLWVLINKFPIFDNAGTVMMVGGVGVDITERKRAEKALRETEEKYRSIFENPVESIFQTTPDGRFIAANPALARMLGFDSPEELISTRTDIAQEHYVDPKSREEFKRSMEENGFVLDFELEAYRKDGSKIWISENVRAVRDHSGTVAYYEGTTQDITGRKRAEEALRESEERYRDLVESSLDLICTHDLDGLILSANRAAMELMGYSSESYAGGTNFREILAPEVRDQFDDYLKRIRADGVASGLMLVQTRTGEKRIWEYHKTLRTQGVSAPIVRGMARDITERRRANHSLRLFRTLIDRSSDAIEVIDPNTLRFLDCNESAYHDLGYTREEFLSLSAYDIDPLADERVAARLTEEMDRSGFVIFESIHRRKDGSTFPVEVNLKIVRLERDYRLAVVRDITERKAAEEKLKATSEQLRALSARLQSAREEEGTRIAREIHDELGSALTSLKWDLEETDGMLAGPMEPSQLAAVREKLQALMKLTDLAGSAIRRIASELRPSVLDDLGLVEAIEWQAQQFHARTGIVCYCDCSLEKVELSEEQSTAVFRILQEALTNVLRHAQATRVDIKINKENGYFALSISDNGKGITESEKSEQQSLGILGMRERAHLIGGEIDIKGVEGKGTVVIVRVPISGQQRVLKMTR